MWHNSNLAKLALDLPRSVKRGIVLLLDILICALTIWISFYLRLGEWISFYDLTWGLDYAFFVAVALCLPIFIFSGFYRAIFRYSGWAALKTIFQFVGLYGFIYALVFTVYGVQGVPRTIGIIQPILLLLFIGASRVIASNWLGESYQKRLNTGFHRHALIYGAGYAGRQLAAAFINNHEIRVVGFIDDDKSFSGSILNGLKIYSSRGLDDLVKQKKITDVFLAIPSASREHRNQIISKLQSINVAVRTLPSVVDLAKGKIDVIQMCELDVDDLLGRHPVVPNQALLKKCITGKVVMVTGAGGSIGGELCRQILLLQPKTLLLIDQSEFSLYGINLELETMLVNMRDQKTKIIPLLASVQDDLRMRQIYSLWRPHSVYHAAAYKHVPLVEHNAIEGIRNNVFGTLVAAQQAQDFKVENFVLISTDKAVRPTNIMGASKRLAEMALQALAQGSAVTKFSMVRFGNVLGSSGSVVPRFREQIKLGGPVTVTHPDITRYFMTSTEAAQLVLQASSMAEGGDVFLLEMGEPVKILDLAHRMIKLAGYTLRSLDHPGGDIAIEFSGLRPGEKLYEELLIGENPLPTLHPRIMRSKEEFIPHDIFQKKLIYLNEILINADHQTLSNFLIDVVSGYVPNKKIADWAHVEENSKT